MSGGVITSKHPKMTNEMYMEVLDIFKTLSEDHHFDQNFLHYFLVVKIFCKTKLNNLDHFIVYITLDKVY